MQLPAWYWKPCRQYNRTVRSLSAEAGDSGGMPGTTGGGTGSSTGTCPRPQPAGKSARPAVVQSVRPLLQTSTTRICFNKFYLLREAASWCWTCKESSERQTGDELRQGEKEGRDSQATFQCSQWPSVALSASWACRFYFLGPPQDKELH